MAALIVKIWSSLTWFKLTERRRPAGRSIGFRIRVLAMQFAPLPFFFPVVTLLSLWRLQLLTGGQSWTIGSILGRCWKHLGSYISMLSWSHIFTGSLQGSFIPLKSNTRIPPRHPCQIWSVWPTWHTLFRYCNRYRKADNGFQCCINSLSKGNRWISTSAELESLLTVNQCE